jgi:hypothetical protein
MAPRAAAWVAWAAWICKYRSNGSCNQERAGRKSALFFWVRPAGRTHDCPRAVNIAGKPVAALALVRRV